MKLTTTILAFLFFCTYAMAATTTSWTMMIKGQKKPVIVKTIKVQNAEVSENCAKKCTALEKLAAKPSSPGENPVPQWTGHPASVFCQSIGGMNRIFKNSKNQEYDFCEFKDKSYIDAWDLFYKHFPRP